MSHAHWNVHIRKVFDVHLLSFGVSCLHVKCVVVRYSWKDYLLEARDDSFHLDERDDGDSRIERDRDRQTDKDNNQRQCTTGLLLLL